MKKYSDKQGINKGYMGYDDVVWQCNSYKNIWMNEVEKDTAYLRKDGKFRPYRTFTSKYTGEKTIAVKYPSGHTKYYAIKDIYNWIWNKQYDE